MAGRRPRGCGAARLAIEDFSIAERALAQARYRRALVTTGNIVDKPDLSKVDEIGFVDLMPGSGHGPGGWSDVAQIEVYGNAVPRK